MPVQVVVELTERTVPQASGICVDAKCLAVACGPVCHFAHILEVAVVVDADIERVEELLHVGKRLRAFDVHVDAQAYLHFGKPPTHHSRDERGGRGQVFWEEPIFSHFFQHLGNMFRECL